MQTYSIAQARNQLPSLVHEVEGGSAVQLTRRGKAVAVVLGFHNYERLKTGGGFRRAYEQLREEFDFDKMAIDPEEVFSRDRDEGPGREFSW